MQDAVFLPHSGCIKVKWSEVGWREQVRHNQQNKVTNYPMLYSKLLCTTTIEIWHICIIGNIFKVFKGIKQYYWSCIIIFEHSLNLQLCLSLRETVFLILNPSRCGGFHDPLRFMNEGEVKDSPPFWFFAYMLKTMDFCNVSYKKWQLTICSTIQLLLTIENACCFRDIGSAKVAILDKIIVSLFSVKLFFISSTPSILGKR